MGIIKKVKNLVHTIYSIRGDIAALSLEIEKLDINSIRGDIAALSLEIEKLDIRISELNDSRINVLNEKIDACSENTINNWLKLNHHDIVLGRLERNQISLRTAAGRIEGRQKKQGDNVEFQVFSQWGEDGIIQHIVQNIKLSNKTFVEFGVENYTESNTRFLVVNNGWSGLVMDGDAENIEYIKNDPIYWTYNVKPVRAFITAENINDLCRENGFTGKIGLLSIDIDGNDYWVWKAIDVVDPDIVICEYNPRFGDKKAVTIPYDPEWTRFKGHYSGIYFGASIRALTKLGNEKGYALVYGNEANLFFVKRELLNDVIHECSVESAYHKNGYQDSRDKDGRLNRISYQEEQEILRNLPFIEV